MNHNTVQVAATTFLFCVVGIHVSLEYCLIRTAEAEQICHQEVHHVQLCSPRRGSLSATAAYVRGMAYSAATQKSFRRSTIVIACALQLSKMGLIKVY